MWAGFLILSQFICIIYSFPAFRSEEKKALTKLPTVTKENHGSQKVRIFPVFPPVLFYLLVKGTELHYYPQQGNTSVLSEGACLAASCWAWGWWLRLQGRRYSRQGRSPGLACVGVSWEPWQWHAGGRGQLQRARWGSRYWKMVVKAYWTAPSFILGC